ncbi:MAG TPA: 4-amino-4-deoxy-L-arabinose transferase, partial [Bacteroidales bacterium]|nr:4-amino-4-deoxy-L-arabinose transferase [Bacteroidales bacterium]
MSFYSKYLSSKSFNIFLLVLVAVNLLQSGFTLLNNDEAYYWMYSKYPDWGYFDHPPMIAIMIKAGYLLFQNELGVRLLVVLSMAGSIMLIWSLIDREAEWKKENILYFIMMVLILPVFNIYGFIATPDSPLIFFSVLFLFAYRRFLSDTNWKNTLLIGISMAALMYSKYHAALLIILVILSNPGLLKNLRFYLAAILAVLLFVPHIYWQFINDFPSFKYHLAERVSGFDFGNIPEYLGNTLIFHNPVILPLSIWLFAKCRPADKFERALWFIFFGFLVFFLLASFRYHVQPQWTV